MSRKIRFLLNATQLVEDRDVIKSRITDHYLRLKARAAAQVSGEAVETGEAPSLSFLDDGIDEPTISWEMRKKIDRRATYIAKRHARLNGLGHLKSEPRATLLAAPRVMSLEGPADEHAADEIAAALFEESPWLQPAIELIWRDMRRFAREGLGLKFRPILLDGPPGIGKTHLARRVAELSGLPELNFDVGSSTEGWRITGMNRGWGSSYPSSILSCILDMGCANPVVFIDEIDKAGTCYSKTGVSTSIVTSLLPLIEPRSAYGWECPFYGCKFDMSHVNWILASNQVELVPEPLRTRVQVVPLSGMGHEDLIGAAARECRRRDLSDEAVEDVAQVLSALPRGHPSLNMRTLSRLLDDRAELERQPLLN
jgi:hypothetical protein